MTEERAPDDPEIAEPDLAVQRIEPEDRPGGGVHELARAFQINAEILRGIQETQKQIAESLQNSDRSEMVIRSADSLNETFRGVRSTQKALMSRIEETRGRPGRFLLIAVGVAIVLGVAVLLGARWLIESTRLETERKVASAWEDDRRARDEAQAKVEELGAGLEAARRDLDRARRDRDDLSEDLEAGRSIETDLRGRLAALETLPRQLDEMRADVRAREDRLGDRDARIVSLEKQLLELQRREGELVGKLELREERLRALEAELARREGLDPGAAAKPKPPLAEPEIPEAAVTNPDQISGLLRVLNRQLASEGKDERWRIDSVKGVSDRKLLGVVARNYGLGVTMQKIIRCEECLIVLRPEARTVELRFFRGTIQFSAGTEIRFPGDRYFVFIAGIDPAAWRRASMTILTEE